MGFTVEQRLVDALGGESQGPRRQFTGEGQDGHHAAFIHDDTRDGSAELIAAMKERNINVEILSGDHQQAVSEFARSVGLPESAAHGGLSPEEKVAWVQPARALTSP